MTFETWRCLCLPQSKIDGRFPLLVRFVIPAESLMPAADGHSPTASVWSIGPSVLFAFFILAE